MSFRRVLALLFIVAGLLLCGAAALHFLRGFDGQTAGRRAFEERRAARPPLPREPEQAPDTVPVAAAIDRPQLYPLGQPIARICIPAARIDAIVFGGSEPDILEKGPGHVPGTELPGGRSGLNNCVITAHRDSHFRNLGWLKAGQRIELETAEAEESYRVVSREIVEPDAVRVLEPTATRRLTLITCYPFNYIGPAPHRLVVVAEPETH